MRTQLIPVIPMNELDQCLEMNATIELTNHP